MILSVADTIRWAWLMNAEMDLEVRSCGLIEVLPGHGRGRKDRGEPRMKNIIAIVYDLSKIWKKNLQYNKYRELTIHQPSVLVEINVTVLNGISGGRSLTYAT